MPNPTSIPAFQNNQLVRALEMQSIEDGFRNLYGTGCASILGVTSANSMDAPFTVTVSGMTISAGGSGGQKFLLYSASGSRLVDTITPQNFTVPAANASNPRNDLLCATYAQIQSAAGPTSFVTTTGGSQSTSPGTAYNAAESCTFSYVTGAPAASPSDPTSSIPAGAVAVARIMVPAGATSLSASNIVLLIPTMQAQILSGVVGFVDLTSNQTAAGNKTFTGATTAGGLKMIQTDAQQTATASLRVNGTGSVVLSPNPSTTGHGIYLGYDDSNLQSVNFGPQNLWGFVGPYGLTSADGSARYGQYCYLQNGNIHVGPTQNLNFGTVGDGIFERGSTGCIYFGNSGSRYLYYSGTSYALAGAPLSLDTGQQFIIQGSGVVTYSSLSYPNSGGTTQITANNATTAQVVSSAFGLSIDSITNILAVDRSGNFGAAGKVYSGTAFGLGNTTLGISGNTAVQGISAQSLLITNSGTNCVTIDNAGNVGVASSMKAASLVSSGGFVTLNTTNFAGGISNASVQGVGSQALLISGSSNNLAAFDQNGNVGILGGFYVGTVNNSTRSITASNDIVTAGAVTSSKDVTASGKVFSSAGVAVSAVCPPVYGPSNNSISPNMRIITGQAYISYSNSYAGNYYVDINLSSPTTFSNVSTVQAFATAIYNNTTQSYGVVCWTNIFGTNTSDNSGTVTKVRIYCTNYNISVSYLFLGY